MGLALYQICLVGLKRVPTSDFHILFPVSDLHVHRSSLATASAAEQPTFQWPKIHTQLHIVRPWLLKITKDGPFGIIRIPLPVGPRVLDFPYPWGLVLDAPRP